MRYSKPPHADTGIVEILNSLNSLVKAATTVQPTPAAINCRLVVIMLLSEDTSFLLAYSDPNTHDTALNNNTIFVIRSIVSSAAVVTVVAADLTKSTNPKKPITNPAITSLFLK